MKSIPSALAEMMQAFGRLGSERATLELAQGRVLAEAVRARFDLPAFDNSAMDGYAVRAEDVAGASAEASVGLPLLGESRAGGPPPQDLQAGSAMRIFTGAPLPLGADAVVMQEDTERDGETVRIALAASAGKHVRRQGEDLRAGELLFAAGTTLGPGELGLLASQQYAAVTVARRPRVALLSTGDELRDLGDPLEPGSIVNSNAYALSAQVRAAGGEPWVLPIVPDDPEATERAVAAGLQADVLISIGGVSVGEYDYVRAAFEAQGVEHRFWKVAIKPGKPIQFGVHGTTPVIGLPGNPVSAMVTFEVFVRPGLRRMLGDPKPYRARTLARLEAAHRHKTGRTELARGRLTWKDEGLTVRLLGRQGSGSLPSVVGTDALAVLPADQAEFVAGEQVPVILLRLNEGVADSPFTG